MASEAPRRLLIYCLFLALLALPAATGATDGSTISLVEWWALAAESHEMAQALPARVGEAERAQLASLAQRWERVERVLLPDGSQLAVDHATIVALLRADPADPDALRERFGALLESRQWAQREHDPAALATLEEILDRAAYRWPESEPSLLARLLQPLLARLVSLLDRLPFGADAGGYFALLDALGNLLALLAVLALVAVLVYVTRALRTGVVAAEEQLAPGEEGAALTAENALAEAQTLSRGGDYRSAVRYLYLSTLLRLDERGLLRYERSQTNREVIAAVKGRPELVVTLRDVVDVFDRVWYGFQTVDQEAYERYERQVRALRGEL